MKRASKFQNLKVVNGFKFVFLAVFLVAGLNLASLREAQAGTGTGSVAFGTSPGPSVPSGSNSGNSDAGPGGGNPDICNPSHNAGCGPDQKLPPHPGVGKGGTPPGQGVKPGTPAISPVVTTTVKAATPAPVKTTSQPQIISQQTPASPESRGVLRSVSNRNEATSGDIFSIPQNNLAPLPLETPALSAPAQTTRPQAVLGVNRTPTPEAEKGEPVGKNPQRTQAIPPEVVQVVTSEAGTPGANSGFRAVNRNTATQEPRYSVPLALPAAGQGKILIQGGIGYGIVIILIAIWLIGLALFQLRTICKRS